MPGFFHPPVTRRAGLAALFREFGDLYGSRWELTEARSIRDACEELGLPMGYGRVGTRPVQLTWEGTTENEGPLVTHLLDSPVWSARDHALEVERQRRQKLEAAIRRHTLWAEQKRRAGEAREALQKQKAEEHKRKAEAIQRQIEAIKRYSEESRKKAIQQRKEERRQRAEAILAASLETQRRKALERELRKEASATQRAAKRQAALELRIQSKRARVMEREALALEGAKEKRAAEMARQKQRVEKSRQERAETERRALKLIQNSLAHVERTLDEREFRVLALRIGLDTADATLEEIRCSFAP